MRDKHYNIKGIRMADTTWIAFRKLKLESGLSWNLFILKIIREYDKQTS